MPLFIPQRLIAACAILLCSVSFSLHAQVTYQGLLEGVYPARLVIETSNPTATLSISKRSNTIKFVGGCNDGECKYRGVDTSLALVFDQNEYLVTGRIQYGDGTSKSFSAEQVDADTPFASSCEHTFWLRTWTSLDKKHQLTLATLPGKQVKGTFYIAAFGRSFSVSGTAKTLQLDLILEESANKEIGAIAAQLGENGMEANLKLDGSNTPITFELTEEMNLNCLQADGRYDIIYPVVDGTPYASLPIQLWKEMEKQRGDYSHAWFEPSLFNENVLSGWMHFKSPSGQTSQTINLDRVKNSKLKQGKLLGGNRNRIQLIDLYKARAIAQHPLRSNDKFQSWANALDFSAFTLTVEGLSLASGRHPIYGQLAAMVPWRALPKTDNLPDWLAQSN